MDFFDVAILMSWFVMKDDELFDLCTGGEFDRSDVIRVTPVTLVGCGLLKGILTIENKYIRTLKEINESIIWIACFWSMLGVRRVDHALVILLEAIAPGITRMLLLNCADGDVADSK